MSKTLKDFDDYMKKQPLSVKLFYWCWGVIFAVQDWWWLKTNSCPHNSTFGRVNSKQYTCLLCGKSLSHPKEKEEVGEE